MLELTDIQKQLLNLVQWSFPVCARPYEAIGEKLGISEEEVIEELRTVKEADILRQLSAIFDTRALGYQSALIAANMMTTRSKKQQK